MKKVLIFILSTVFAFQAVANENALMVVNQLDTILSPKENAITLEQAKELAAGENIDIKFAYEQLFQAQRKISQARANYFPYGVGDIFFIYFQNVSSTLILIQLATSLPMKWYFVQKEKYIRNAEAFNLKALRVNIKNEIASMYYSVLKEEALLKISSYQLGLMEEMATALDAKVAVGLVDSTEVDSLRWRTLRVRDDYLKFEAYLAKEKSAFRQLLNLPYNSKVELQPVRQYLSHEDFAVDVENLARTAQNRSFEVKSAQEMINAAHSSKSSAKWSILSFGGIGFGHFAKVRVEGSKVQEQILRKEVVEDTIYSNTYSREKMFRSSVDFFLSTKNIADTTKSYMYKHLADFKAGNIDTVSLIESELYFMKDFSSMVIAHYNSLSRLDDLERIVLGKVKTTEFKENDFEIQRSKSRKSTKIFLEAPVNMYDIQSVTYTVNGQYGRDFKSFNSKSNYSIKLKNKYLSETVEGSALIIFDNGEVIKKHFKL